MWAQAVRLRALRHKPEANETVPGGPTYLLFCVCGWVGRSGVATHRGVEPLEEQR